MYIASLLDKYSFFEILFFHINKKSSKISDFIIIY